jgi:hypothetical protein
MRLIALAAFASLLATPVLADTMTHCSAAWKAKTAETSSAGTYKAWSAICLKADYKIQETFKQVFVPPPGATAQCKDGTYSMSKTAQGRCSGHGGVAKVL